MTSKHLSKEQLQERFSHGSGQSRLLNLQALAVNAEAQEITVLAPFREEFERGKDSGQWHGGPIASVIDTVGDFALIVLLGRGLPTINLRVDYLKPAKGDLTVIGRVRRNGRNVGVSDVDVFDASGALVAIGRGAYSTQAAR